MTAQKADLRVEALIGTRDAQVPVQGDVIAFVLGIPCAGLKNLIRPFQTAEGVGIVGREKVERQPGVGIHLGECGFGRNSRCACFRDEIVSAPEFVIPSMLDQVGRRSFGEAKITFLPGQKIRRRQAEEVSAEHRRILIRRPDRLPVSRQPGVKPLAGRVYPMRQPRGHNIMQRLIPPKRPMHLLPAG